MKYKAYATYILIFNAYEAEYIFLLVSLFSDTIQVKSVLHLIPLHLLQTVKLLFRLV